MANGKGGNGGNGELKSAGAYRGKGTRVLAVVAVVALARLLALPGLTGAACVDLLERVAGSISYSLYSTALHAMGGGTIAMTAAVIWDSKNGYSREWLRQPDPREQSPGAFCLGAALVALIYRWWWGYPAGIVGMTFFTSFWDERGLGNFPREIFWNGMVMVSSFIALAAALLLAVGVVGLIVRQRLRERGRPV